VSFLMVRLLRWPPSQPATRETMHTSQPTKVAPLQWTAVRPSSLTTVILSDRDWSMIMSKVQKTLPLISTVYSIVLFTYALFILTESVGHPPGSDLFPAMFLDNSRYGTLVRASPDLDPGRVRYVPSEYLRRVAARSLY
jgi:hypothetical protein